MFCPNCGKEIEDDSLFCNKCGSKILNEEIKIDNKQEEVKLNEDVEQDDKKLSKTNSEPQKEVNFNKIVQVHKKLKLIIGIVFVLLILIFSITYGYKYHQNIQVQNKENAIKIDIKNKIVEADKIAQSGKYLDAFGSLRKIQVSYDLSKYPTMSKEIELKQKEYDFKAYYTSSSKKIEDKDFYSASDDLQYLLKNYNQKEETKKLCNDTLKKIDNYLDVNKKNDFGIETILTLMAITYPEKKESIKAIFNKNDSYNEIHTSLDDSIHYATHSDEEVHNEHINDLPKEPSIGMTADEVRNSTWKNPEKVNQTITLNGKHEQWVYSGDKYVYFDNGVVTAIQK